MITKTQVRMVQLALANGGTPVASCKWISEGFDYQRPDRYVLYYNVGRDTKVMVRYK